MRDITKAQRDYEDCLRTGDLSRIRYAVILFETLPPLLLSTVHSPQHDFEGDQIQNLLDPGVEAEPLSCSIFANGETGVAVISWLESSHAVISKFVQSLLKIPEAAIGDALVRYSFSCSENMAFNIDWWDGLPQELREKLLKRFYTFTGQNTLLVDDGIKYVDWRVQDIATKM